MFTSRSCNRIADQDAEGTGDQGAGKRDQKRIEIRMPDRSVVQNAHRSRDIGVCLFRCGPIISRELRVIAGRCQEGFKGERHQREDREEADIEENDNREDDASWFFDADQGHLPRLARDGRERTTGVRDKLVEHQDAKTENRR